jgi:sugar lactone lactonase YvrE
VRSLATPTVLVTLAACGGRTSLLEDAVVEAPPDATDLRTRDAGAHDAGALLDASSMRDAFVADAHGRCATSPVYLSEVNYNADTIPVDSDAVYFTGVLGTDFPLERLPKDGGVPIELDPNGVGWPYALDGSFVYWGTDTTIYRVPKGSGATQMVASTPASPSSIALDDTSLYWIAYAPQKPWRLMTAPKTGGTATEIVLDAPFGPVAVSLAVDDRSIYWIDSMDNLRVTPKTGGASTILAPNADDLVADTTSIYFQGRVGYDLYKVPKEGGPAIKLAASMGLTMALGTPGNDYVYWADSFAGIIYKVPKEGGTAQVVVQAPGVGAALSVDDYCVYWVARRGQGQFPALMKADN